MTQQQHEVPVSITSARSAHSDSIRRRQTRYLLSMGIRTVCFALAIVVPSPGRWVFVAAALVLPYIAVVIANTGEDREEAGPEPFDDQRPQITTGRVPSGRGSGLPSGGDGAGSTRE